MNFRKWFTNKNDDDYEKLQKSYKSLKILSERQKEYIALQERYITVLESRLENK